MYQNGHGAGRKSQSPGGHATLSLPLRFAAKILYELCLGVFLCLTKPAFMRRPWRITPCPAVHGWAFLCFMCINLQYLNSFAIHQAISSELRFIWFTISIICFAVLISSLKRVVILPTDLNGSPINTLLSSIFPFATI